MVWASDFRNDASKDASRAYNVAQIQRLRDLFDRQTGKLKCDWAELAGEGAPTMGMLESLNMLGPARFLGIERDPKVFTSLVEEYGASSDRHAFFKGDLEAWIGGGSSRGVGVLNFDSQNTAGKEKFAKSLEVMVRFARRQEKKFGAFALIINAGFDRGCSIDTFKSVMGELGLSVSDAHLKVPGVRYGDDREDRNSSRINYCALFGHATPIKQGEQPHYGT